MSILGSLLGRTTILTYRILFDDQDKVSVRVDAKTSPIKQEYIRLYGSYLAKIIYNFGGVTQPTSLIALQLSRRIFDFGISSNADCFNLAEVDDVIEYSGEVGNVVTEFSGTFYGWRNGNRTIYTTFPLKATEQQVVFGSLALIQFAIDENRDNDNNIEILQKMAREMIKMYGSGVGGSMADIASIPAAVFSAAVSD